MSTLKIKSVYLLFTILFLFSSSASSVLALVNYSYDQNGNMVSDGQYCYTYNDANQVSKVKKCSSGQTVSEYLYDYTGRRIVKKEYENGILKQTIYSPDKNYETKKLPNNSTQNTSYYFANDELIARKNPDSSKVFYHNDYLTSTSVLTDGSGSLVEETTYYPYGDIRSGGTKSKYLYTGQEKDTETGLNYYGARYYNSHIRRFTQPDTLLPDPYDPQQLNRYSYTRNNPLKYVDPSGNFPWLVGAAALIAGGYAYFNSSQPAYAPESASNAQQLQQSDIAANSQGSDSFDVLGGSSIHRSADILNNSKSSNTDKLLAGATILGHSLKNTMLIYGTVAELYLAGRGLINSKDISNTETESQNYHGNDLRNTKTTVGYTLRDETTDEIMKFGDTTNSLTRYSRNWLEANNLRFQKEEIGSKLDMHFWQHNQILDYVGQYGNRPILNKSNW